MLTGEGLAFALSNGYQDINLKSDIDLSRLSWDCPETTPFSHDGKLEYTVKEIPIEGYTPSYSRTGNEFTITNNGNGALSVSKKVAGDVGTIAAGETEKAVFTNTYQQEKISVSVTKEWDDNDNQDGIRPKSIKVQLYADGSAIGDPITLGADSQWTYKWEGLNGKDSGNVVVYTVRELEVPDGYTSSVEGSAAQGFTITHKHTSKGTGTSITSGNNTTTPANNKPSTAASSGKKGRVKTPSTGDVPHKEFWVILIAAGHA